MTFYKVSRREIIVDGVRNKTPHGTVLGSGNGNTVFICLVLRFVVPTF